MQANYTLDSIEALAKVAHDLAAELKSGDVVLLYGELGSGKTTFTQALARALGVENTITSPTFTIAAEYPISSHHEINKLVHVDLYRLAEKDVEKDAAVADILEQAGTSGTLVVIEWADRMPRLRQGYGGHKWELHFSHGKEQNERTLSIKQQTHEA